MNTLEPRDKGIVVETMPGISSKIGGKKNAFGNYTVKYLKADFSEPADMLDLQNIETRALHSKAGDEEIVLLDKDKFTFMDKYFIILKYLEKVTG